MRYRDLMEASILDIGLRGSTIPCYFNPSKPQFVTLLAKHGELRGLIDNDGNNYLWESYKIEHGSARLRLGVEPAIIYIVKRRLAGRLAGKIVLELYMIDDSEPNGIMQYPNFASMIKGVQVYGTDDQPLNKTLPKA